MGANRRCRKPIRAKTALPARSQARALPSACPLRRYRPGEVTTVLAGSNRPCEDHCPCIHSHCGDFSGAEKLKSTVTGLWVLETSSTAESLRSPLA